MYLSGFQDKDLNRLWWMPLFVRTFDIIRHSINRTILLPADNEIDGDAFLLLSEGQIKRLIPSIGPQVKLIRKHKDLLPSLPKAMVIEKE